MSKVEVSFVSATEFHAEKWTIISGPNGTRELWAVIMDNGSQKDCPCAFGSQASMTNYAESLNLTSGSLR